MLCLVGLSRSVKLKHSNQSPSSASCLLQLFLLFLLKPIKQSPGISNMATVIGVVSGLMTIFTFLDDNFSTEQPTNSDSKMRIVAALDGTNGKLTNAGGDYPDVRLFGENGEFLGAEYDPGYVDDGTHYDLTIHQSTGQQPTYALFSGNTDAICIAYIASTWPDNQNYGWVGSWGRRCGHSW